MYVAATTALNYLKSFCYQLMTNAKGSAQGQLVVAKLHLVVAKPQIG